MTQVNTKINNMKMMIQYMKRINSDITIEWINGAE